ncbi:MAG: 3-hydroxyacyl-CoA dehydrogenase family protein [Rubrobacteraceae bacterium]
MPVGVLGTGAMGAGIVQVAASSGHEVTACDPSVEALEKAQIYVRRGLERFEEKGVVENAEAAYELIRWTGDMDEMREAEAVIEVAPERVGLKKKLFAELDEMLPPDSLILTNTSSISITALASATKRPEKVCGTHFFTPPPLRDAVEVPRGLLTSDETIGRVKRLITSFGKLPVVVEKDVPGFVANRFLMPILIEACRLLEEGVAEKEDMDLLMKKGLGFPIGPFELGDMIGLDVALDVIEYVHTELGEPYYAPPRILKRMVEAGKLGRKSGEGFYGY